MEMVRYDVDELGEKRDVDGLIRVLRSFSPANVPRLTRSEIKRSKIHILIKHNGTDKKVVEPRWDADGWVREVASHELPEVERSPEVQRLDVR